MYNNNNIIADKAFCDSHDASFIVSAAESVDQKYSVKPALTGIQARNFFNLIIIFALVIVILFF